MANHSRSDWQHTGASVTPSSGKALIKNPSSVPPSTTWSGGIIKLVNHTGRLLPEALIGWHCLTTGKRGYLCTYHLHWYDSVNIKGSAV